MVMGSITTRMETIMKVNHRMEEDMDRENIYLMMAKNMWDSMKMIKGMVRAHFILITDAEKKVSI